MRAALFWAITQRVAVTPCRRFGTTYRVATFYLDSGVLKTTPIGCPEK